MIFNSGLTSEVYGPLLVDKIWNIHTQNGTGSARTTMDMLRYDTSHRTSKIAGRLFCGGQEQRSMFSSSFLLQQTMFLDDTIGSEFFALFD